VARWRGEPSWLHLPDGQPLFVAINDAVRAEYGRNGIRFVGLVAEPS
jgi:hypothetical protein